MKLPPTPLFPLTHPLFPGGRVALRIFEPRYLDMIGRAAREGSAFVIVRLTAGTEVQRPAGAEDAAGDGGVYASESFEAMGTLANLDHVDRPQPGLLRIVVRGGGRVRITKPQRLPTGLWMGDVEPVADDMPVPVPPDLQALADTLRAAGIFDASAPADAHFDDCGWLANRLAERLPIHPAAQQRLLEQGSPLLRLELVADHLRMLRDLRDPRDPRDPGDPSVGRST